ncbi:MAG: hypothetical protein ABIS50_08070 [Luteolibacter sp.]|uniref:hypothetical protein n=1 Tax=Luteolibacter sp. TaxID=1962973 RepID=UPI0032678BDA
MNNAKWIALRWSLFLLLAICGLSVLGTRKNSQEVKIANLQVEISTLSQECARTKSVAFQFKQELDLLKEEIRRKDQASVAK